MKINSLLIKSFVWMLQGCPLYIGAVAAAVVGGVAAGAVGAIGAGVSAGVQAKAGSKAAAAAKQTSLENQALANNAYERSKALQDKALVDAGGYLKAGTAQARADISPYAQAGLGALQQLQAGMSGGQAAQAAHGTTPQQLAQITGQFNQSQQAIADKEAKFNAIKQQGAGVQYNGNNLQQIYQLQQAGNQAQRDLDAAKAAHQTNVTALQKAQSDPYMAAQKAISSQDSTFNRDFNAKDYRADPTTGGRAPPNLTTNFDEQTWLKNRGMNGRTLTKSFTNADFIKDPGYQWRMDQGNKAVEASGAARGMQLSGATMKALNEYGQGFASNEYGAAYNRYGQNQKNQQSERNTAYDIFGKNRDNAANVYGNAFNRWTSQQGNKFNRLSSLAGSGQNAATNQAEYINGLGTNLANLNTGYATNVGNLDMEAATGQMGQNQNASEARQAAAIRSGNAWGGLATNLGNTAAGGLYDYYTGGRGGNNNLNSSGQLGNGINGNPGFNQLQNNNFWK